MQTPQTHRTISRIGLIAFWAALVIAVALIALPAIGTFLLSFQNYRMTQGFFSPFVGLRNYQALFQSPEYGVSLLQTIKFSALSALTLFAAGALAGYLLRGIALRWLRHALCTVLLVPLLVPGGLWAHAFFAVFSTQAVQSLVLLALWCGIKYIGLAALLVTAALAQGNRSATAPLLSAGAGALGLFALLGLQDYMFLRMLSPLSAMQSSMDMFIYHSAFTLAQLSVSSALTMLAVVLRAVMTAIVAWPVAALLLRLFPKKAEALQTTTKDRLLSLLAAGAVTVAILVVLAVVSRGAPLASMANVLHIYPVYILLAFVGAAVNTGLCYCLARPVITARLPALRGGSTAFLLLLTALGAAPIFAGGYLQARALGLVNTFFPVLFSGVGSVLGAWPLVFAARAMGVTDDAQWRQRMWRPSLALLAVSAALRMNDAVPSTIYLPQADLMHPLQALSNIQSSLSFLQKVGQEPTLPLFSIIALIALVSLLLPTILLLVVRTVFTEQETLGLGLPTK